MTQKTRLDYERGLEAFKRLAEGTDWYQDFTVYEAPLRENLRDERQYGPSEQSRRDRTRLTDQLNGLALEHLGISFNDLCLGLQPTLKKTTQPTPGHQDMSEGAKGDAAPAPTPAVLNTGQAWAVLVGINTYEDAYIADLQVCVGDVAAVHRALAPSYQVARLLTDATPERLPTRANILGELSILSQAAGEGDLLLFYFSGHGMAEEGESYLLPRDARLAALKHTAVNMRDVRELIEQSPARAKVIVLDACHSGASIGKAGPAMTPEFIQQVFEKAQGIAVLASCMQKQQSWEWPAKKQSVFTYYLLEALRGQADLDNKGFVTVSDASRYVTDGVKRWAAQEGVPQTPTLQYTVAGDIILLRYPKPS